MTIDQSGNSIGDMISDTTMARRGSPRTGFSACFGGPLFNLLLGIGLPFTIELIQGGGPVISLGMNQTNIYILLDIKFFSQCAPR